jgi:hypothetical protein
MVSRCSIGGGAGRAGNSRKSVQLGADAKRFAKVVGVGSSSVGFQT